MTKIFKIEQSIYEDLASFYGKIFNLPPLAGKIYALLIFDTEKQGLTFEELVDYFDASKSSVSSSLNLLLSEKLLKHLHKSDQRKRYFVTNQEYAKIRFQKIVNKMQTEVEILERLNTFQNNSDEKYNEKFQIYRSLLYKNIENIQDSLKKIYDEI